VLIRHHAMQEWVAPGNPTVVNRSVGPCVLAVFPNLAGVVSAEAMGVFAADKVDYKKLEADKK
jgi:hypothetical protein